MLKNITYPVKALALGVLVTLVVAGAVFPLGCMVYDGPPGSEPPGAVCPEAEALIGFVWPNMYVGFVLAPVIGLIVGFAAALAFRASRR